RPEQSPSKVAISESFISQEELASRQEMKLTSRPTSFDEISSEKKEDSSPVQEATVPQNDSEQQAIKQPFLNKKLLFLSARAHKLMKNEAAGYVKRHIANYSFLAPGFIERTFTSHAL
ncbi:hypothetical protein L0F63_005978, partial [Massospora cicadina]